MNSIVSTLARMSQKSKSIRAFKEGLKARDEADQPTNEASLTPSVNIGEPQSAKVSDNEGELEFKKSICDS